MAIAVRTLCLGLKITTYKNDANIFLPEPSLKRGSHPLQMRYNSKEFSKRPWPKNLFAVCVVSSGAQDVEVSSSQFQDFVVSTSGTSKTNELKISMEISGDKTQAIFDDVFFKMVADAQPIPGFRRVKGGKTPDVPRDILLEIIGPSKVYKKVIQKVINSTVAEYVEKEGLKVSKDLRVEQSFEDLEAAFEPGDSFSFDAVVQLQESN